MRMDGSADFPRHWALRGSRDLRHWVDLRRHVADASLARPGQFASWPVAGPAARLAYRAFRLVLLGPTASAAAPWNFALGGVEFYGHFFAASDDDGDDDAVDDGEVDGEDGKKGAAAGAVGAAAG